MIDEAGYIAELDKMVLPTVNYHYLVNFGLSSVNFFALAMGLFMFAGIGQYLIGFYDWYQGRTMLSFFDFIYGILHLVHYYTADLGKYDIWVPTEYHTYMQGVFYIFWLVILMFVLISLRGRGCIYMINLFLLALGTIFLLIWEFSGRTWPRKAAGYFYFFASIFIWYTGLGRLMSSIYHCDKAPLCAPYW